jgi:hypothetical protein
MLRGIGASVPPELEKSQATKQSSELLDRAEKERDARKSRRRGVHLLALKLCAALYVCIFMKRRAEAPDVNPAALNAWKMELAVRPRKRPENYS